MQREGAPKSPESNKDKAFDPLGHLKSLILSDEEYVLHPFAQDPKVRTYSFEISSGEKVLMYFGANHSTDPSNIQFSQIKRIFEIGNPELVFVEGKRGTTRANAELREKISTLTEDEIKTKGEGTYSVALALGSSAEIESPEPGFLKEITYLEKNEFSRQQIFNFYIYRQIWQYQREQVQVNHGSCEEYLEKYIGQFFRESEWESAEINQYKSELLADLDISNHRKYYEQVDPIPWEGRPQNVYNEISRQSGRFRDEFALERIALGLETHDRVLVVFGSAHAVRLEPALRELMTQFDTLDK